MGRVFFTADTHFGHANVIQHCSRPFASADEMDEHMIREWNDVVSDGDVVWHLGDFAYRCSNGRALSIFSRLNGTKHLVRGNHEKIGRQMPWASQHDLVDIAVYGQRLILCHYALRVWNGSHRGSIHLYGHSHGTLPGTAQSLDVGVDCWDFRPVYLPQIKARLDLTAAAENEGFKP